MFKNYWDFPLICDEETPIADTQEHVLNCKSLNSTFGEETPTIEFMYGDIKQQVQLAKQFSTKMKERTCLLEPQEEEEVIQNIK